MWLQVVNPREFLPLICTFVDWLVSPYSLLSFTEGVTGLKELAFMRDLAEQNSAKYGISDRSQLPVVKGSMMVLNQLSNLETSVGRFYINLPNRMIDVASFSLPYADQMGDGELGHEAALCLLSFSSFETTTNTL